MTKHSLLKLMFLMQITDVKFYSMLTLTYPKYYPRDGKAVKGDLQAMLQKIRRLQWSYVWFLEFQERGAPHIHILTTCDSLSPYIRVDMGLYWTERIAKSKWFLQVCPVMDYEAEVLKMARFNTHHSVFGLLVNENGARNYVSKYAAKERQKTVPEMYKSVGRFWGASRDVKPEGVTVDATEEDIEHWLAENGHPAGAYDLVPKYVWQINGRVEPEFDPETFTDPDEEFDK